MSVQGIAVKNPKIAHRLAGSLIWKFSRIAT